jgi:hypothetical protein
VTLLLINNLGDVNYILVVITLCLHANVSQREYNQ